MTTQSSCNISYYTSLERSRTVRIPNPIDNLGVSTAQTAAGRIASANPFDETIGMLMGIKSINVTTVTRNELFRV